MSNKTDLLNALKLEIIHRHPEAVGIKIDTLYFGGGTPSVLSVDELESILKTIQNHYSFSENPEITLEANPDDIHLDYLLMIKDLGINRLSIGVQSFFDDQLSWMNRAHSAYQSHTSIEMALHSGFNNFSIDLMYGLPDGQLKNWSANLNTLLQYQIPHLSCYALTIEERTALSQRIKQHTIKIPEDSLVIDQMNMLFDFCTSNQYEAYEISNFAKAGFRSRHNSSYWKGISYWGFGPSAHSFYENQRRWNISNNALYIQAIQNNLPYYETELLSRQNQCNEFIMLQLRRIEGIDKAELKIRFPEFEESILKELEEQVILKNIIKVKEQYILSRQGKYMADEISSKLFVT